MHFIWNGIREAIHLILHPDSQLLSVVAVTFWMTFWSTTISVAIGLPIACALGLGRFRGRRLALGLTNAGLAMPPVVVGLIVVLLLFRESPLGFLGWVYTLRGVIFAQVLLSLPIVIAFSTSAILGVDPDLFRQAQALGASRLRVSALAIREARVGVIGAAIGAMGSALAEVGAVVMVGGNIQGSTETLAGGVLVDVSSGDYAHGIALGIILLGLILILTGAMTLVQHGSERRRGGPVVARWQGVR
jgi:ABC-type tungstate transport system substrate-binding protein